MDKEMVVTNFLNICDIRKFFTNEFILMFISVAYLISLFGFVITEHVLFLILLIGTGIAQIYFGIRRIFVCGKIVTKK